MTPPVIFDVQGVPIAPPTFDGEPIIKGLEAHLYIVEFGDHRIKVGYTANPQRRLESHEHQGRCFGHPVTRCLLTPPHVEARANERTLLRMCRDAEGLPVDYRGEYFSLDLETVRKFIDDLPRSRGDREAYEAEMERRVAPFKEWLKVNQATPSTPQPFRFPCVFPWAALLEAGDLAVFLNGLRDAMEMPDPLAAIDHVAAEWFMNVFEDQRLEAEAQRIERQKNAIRMSIEGGGEQ